MDIEAIMQGGGAVAAAGAGITFTLHKLGLLTFGKKGRNGHSRHDDEGGGCPDPECHESVMLSIQSNKVMGSDVKEIKADVRKLFGTVDDLGRDIAFIRGRMER